MRENIIKPLSGNFYKETKNKLLNLIEEKNLDGFLVTNPANIFYFTGFFYVTNERPSGFYLSKNNISKLFIPLLEKENAENLQVNEIHIYEEFPGETNPYTFMANTISEKKIGTDIKNTDILNLIKNNFEELNHKTGIEMFRYVKLDEEINLIIEATKYADLALEYLKECAKEMINKNLSERELVQICTEYAKNKMLNNISKEFDETPCNVVATIHSGPRGAYPHGKSLSRVPNKNETLICGVGACLGGVYAESGVTFILGEPNEDQKKIIKVMKEVNDEVVNNLKEGFICEDINKVALNIYNNYGLSKFVRHRIGHGMGFEGHEAPWLSPGDKTLLTKNMVFSNEPGIYRPGVDGYRTISSMIVDKEKGIQIPNFLDKNIEERIINLN
ncbi:MAG: aminopeptidase P family protein [Pelagibacteraceae bacterium]|nr:aminopeptidase P family protein [Pelagibacteraceae bacterium]